jgi:hypothetical protein
VKQSTANSLFYLHFSPIFIFCIPLSTLSLSFLLTYSLCILSIFPSYHQSSFLLRFFFVETVKVRVNIAQNSSLQQNSTQSNALYTALYQCLLRSPICRQAQTKLHTHVHWLLKVQTVLTECSRYLSLKNAAITKCSGGCRFPTQ